MLGHANISITLDTYSHVIPGMGDAAAGAMDEALGGGASLLADAVSQFRASIRECSGGVEGGLHVLQHHAGHVP